MGKEAVVVIGAGVIGLSTALLLHESLPERFGITIVARELPGDESVDYATPWSGAHYRPIPDASPQGLREDSLAKKTYDHFKSYAKSNPDAGIRFMRGMDLLESPSQEYLKTVGHYADIDDFRVLSARELPYEVKWGATYTTWCANTPVYIEHLMRKFILKGGRIIRKSLENLDQAFTVKDNVRTVINCSGIGFDDPLCFIIRGQTCIVANEANETITRQNSDGTWTFVIPRPLHEGTIIGKTKEVRDQEASPRPETRQKLLEAGARAFPELLDANGKFRVIRDIVGRRPSRTGGIRLEAEVLENGRRVIHAYGAGGRGVEMSRGIAEAVLELFKSGGDVQQEKAML
ncbi:hypothetical protein B7463_g8524, partial [Scytalidium lignicola]